MTIDSLFRVVAIAVGTAAVTAATSAVIRETTNVISNKIAYDKARKEYGIDQIMQSSESNDSIFDFMRKKR